MSKRIFFISGHRDITEDEFNTHYVPKLNQLINTIPMDDLQFVVGDYYGLDEMAMKWLSKFDVVVYHMFDSPRVYICGHSTVGGFKTDIERDTAMTNISEGDIAWVRPGRENSGTDQNIQRRAALMESKKSFHYKGKVIYNYDTVIMADTEDDANDIFDGRIEQGGITLTNPVVDTCLCRLKD